MPQAGTENNVSSRLVKKFMPPKLSNFLFSEFDKYIQLVVQLRITGIDFHVLVQPMH